MALLFFPTKNHPGGASVKIHMSTESYEQALSGVPLRTEQKVFRYSVDSETQSEFELKKAKGQKIKLRLPRHTSPPSGLPRDFMDVFVSDDDGMFLYPTENHPSGASNEAWYEIRRWDRKDSQDYALSTANLTFSAIAQYEGIQAVGGTGFDSTTYWIYPGVAVALSESEKEQRQVNALVSASGAYFMVLHFMIENAVKVLNQNMAVHDLPRLMKMARVALTPPQENFCRFISEYCFAGRYEDTDKPVIPYSLNANLGGKKWDSGVVTDVKDVRLFINDVTLMALETLELCGQAVYSFPDFDGIFWQGSSPSMRLIGAMTVGSDELRKRVERTNIDLKNIRHAGIK